VCCRCFGNLPAGRQEHPCSCGSNPSNNSPKISCSMRELSGIKICFLAGTLEHGGAERQLFYWLRALCDCGAAPRVLCLDRGEFWETPIKNLGVPVTWVGEHASRLKRLIRIIRDLRKDPPDVFQSQHFFVNAYVSLAASLLGASAIGAMRSDGLTDVLES